VAAIDKRQSRKEKRKGNSLLLSDINTSTTNLYTFHSPLHRYSRIVYKEIKAMNPASRFLKVNPETNLWNDIGMKKALTKICQALHEGSPELKKYLEADDSTSNQSQQADVESTGNEDRKMSLEDTPSKAKPLSLRQKLRQMSDVSISSCALQEVSSLKVGMANCLLVPLVITNS
jgi:hypothetical protein